MQEDMGKPEIEAAGGEIWFVLEEIDYTLRRLKKWMRPQRKRTPHPAGFNLSPIG